MSVYNAITQIAWSYSILILFWFITSFLQSSVVTTANNSFSSWFAWHYFAILERHYPSLMIPQYIFCRPSFVSVYSTPPPTTNPYNNKKRTYASALSNTTHTAQPNNAPMTGLRGEGGFPPGRLGFTMVKPVALIKTRKMDDVQKHNLESQF